MLAEKFGKTSSSGSLSHRFTKVEETGHSEYAVAVDSETITKIVRAQNFSAPEHSHSEAQLSFFRKGSSGTFLTHNVVGKSNSMSVAPGSVAFVPHNQPHRIHWQGDGELLHVYFSLDFMAKVTESGRSAGFMRPLSISTGVHHQHDRAMPLRRVLLVGTVTPRVRGPRQIFDRQETASHHGG